MTDSQIKCPNCSADIPVEVLEVLQQLMIKAFERPQRTTKHIGIDNDCQTCHNPIVYVFEDPNLFYTYTTDQFKEMMGASPAVDFPPQPSEN